MTDDRPARTVREEQQPAGHEITELGTDLRRLQLPISMPGLGHVNCYLLDDERGVALVDPGLPGPTAWKGLRAGLRRAEVPLDAVHTVVVTHSHPDHFGAAGRLRSESGAEVITHQSFRLWWDTADEDADAVDSVARVGDNDALLDDPATARRTTGPGGPTPWGGSGFRLPWHRRLGFGLMRRGLLGRWFPTPEPTRRVAHETVLELGGREWRAVHTPGHTPDHLCLRDADGEVLISGDHVLPTITPHISGLTDDRDPLKEYFTSLDLVADRHDADLVLPAHGHPFSGLSERVAKIKEHHHERLQILREASTELGPATVGELMKRLFKERSWGPMAESETFAHLEHLRLAGEMTASRRPDGQLDYRLT